MGYQTQSHGGLASTSCLWRQLQPARSLMSNQLVPAIYRRVIDDVVTNVRRDFDEHGVDEMILAELQRSWEQKLAASRAADFSSDARMAPYVRDLPPVGSSHAAAGTSGDVKPNISEAGKSSEAAARQGSAAPPAAAEKSKSAPNADDDELGSDLDDSDDEAEGQEQEDGGDLVIALYDKVQRSKNKWKVSLKDGVISVNGREYLFSKCQGEFEW